MRQSQATRSFEIPVEESEPEIFARLKGDLVIAFIHHVQSRFTDDMLARIDALNAGPGPVCHIHCDHREGVRRSCRPRDGS